MPRSQLVVELVLGPSLAFPVCIGQSWFLSSGTCARCWGCVGRSHPCFLRASGLPVPPIPLACSSGSCPGLWKLSGEQRGTSCLSLPASALCLCVRIGVGWEGEVWVSSSLCSASGVQQIGVSTPSLLSLKQAAWTLCCGDGRTHVGVLYA